MLTEIMKEMYGKEIVESVSSCLKDLVNIACRNAGYPEASTFQTYEDKQEHMKEQGLTLNVIGRSSPGNMFVIVHDEENEKIVAVSRMTVIFDGTTAEIEGVSLEEQGIANLNSRYEEFMIHYETV